MNVATEREGGLSVLGNSSMNVAMGDKQGLSVMEIIQ